MKEQVTEIVERIYCDLCNDKIIANYRCYICDKDLCGYHSAVVYLDIPAHQDMPADKEMIYICDEHVRKLIKEYS